MAPATIGEPTVKSLPLFSKAVGTVKVIEKEVHWYQLALLLLKCVSKNNAFNCVHAEGIMLILSKQKTLLQG